MGLARRYIIDVSNVTPSGITTVTITSKHNLTVAFSGVSSNNSSYSYDAITTSQLSQLSYEEYEQRVIDFLEFINIDSVQIKDELMQNATYDNPSCESP